MKIHHLPIVIFVSVPSTITSTASAVTYAVRQPDGANQYYRLEAPSASPAGSKPDPSLSYLGIDKLARGAAQVAAVAWAGCLTKDKSNLADPYLNSMTNIGSDKPGGFYNASYIKVDSVSYESNPIPDYLVRMNGKIGDSRQVFYADVLSDGQLVRPVPIVPVSSTTYRKSHPNLAWGGASEANQWGGAQKKQWGGADQKEKTAAANKSDTADADQPKKDNSQ